MRVKCVDPTGISLADGKSEDYEYEVTFQREGPHGLLYRINSEWYAAQRFATIEESSTYSPEAAATFLTHPDLDVAGRWHDYLWDLSQFAIEHGSQLHPRVSRLIAVHLENTFQRGKQTAHNELNGEIQTLTERVTERNERIALLIRERDKLKSEVKSLEARVKRRDERVAAMKSHLEWREAQPSYKVIQGEKVDLKRHDVLLCSGWVEGWRWVKGTGIDTGSLLWGAYAIDKHDWVCVRPSVEKSVADILRAHQQLEDSTCLCGFKELGASHAEHVENILGLAGKLKEKS